MNTIADFMGADHDRLDELFRTFQSVKVADTAKARDAFVEFKRGLQRHIVWEEEFLFPKFERRTGVSEGGPTAVMRMEHRRLKELLEGMHERVAVGNMDAGEYEHELADVLLVHNTKEESILYPAIDRLLTGPEAETMIAAMQALPAERYAHCCGS